MKKTIAILFTVALIITGVVGTGQSSLIVDDGTNYPLIGTGMKEGGTDHHQDTFGNVDYLLDHYYSRDVETIALGKLEDDTTTGVFNTWDFAVFDESGNPVEFGSDTKGTFTITVESTDTIWIAPIWYSLKSSTEFRLYDTGITAIIPPGSGSTVYTVNWETWGRACRISAFGQRQPR